MRVLCMPFVTSQRVGHNIIFFFAIYFRPTLVWVVQRPGLLGIKVRVTSNPRSWVVGVRQRAALPVEQRHVAVETGGEQHQYVGQLRPAAADVADGGQLLEGERRDAAPHVERPADGVRGPLLAQRRGELLLHEAADARGGSDVRERLASRLNYRAGEGRFAGLRTCR